MTKTIALLCALALSSAGEIDELFLLKDYTAQRASSYDRTGANDDGNWNKSIKADDTACVRAAYRPATPNRGCRRSPSANTSR